MAQGSDWVNILKIEIFEWGKVDISARRPQNCHASVLLVLSSFLKSD